MWWIWCAVLLCGVGLIGAPAALAAWVETPEGVRWLHQLLLAAEFSRQRIR